MPQFQPVPSSFGALKDQVVVLTGGANGIGLEIVRKLYQAGAHVVFGDIDEVACQAAVDGLKSEIPSSSGLFFLRTDVRRYEDNLALFKCAYEKYGRVDHALSIAGVTEQAGKNWFDPKLDLSSVTAAPSTDLVDINLTGVLYFARIAAVYLRQGNDGRAQDKSICLLGSVASFKEQGGLFVYQPAKHGVLGLVRSTRKFLDRAHGIRINTVCPSATRTRMATAAVADVWAAQGVRLNDPRAVADYVLTLTSVPRDPHVGNVTGLAVFVEADKGWEIEKDLDRCDASWLGEEMSRNAAKIEAALASGTAWSDPQ
ncbi:putative 3-hydroxyacyl-CoA dehydrogenase [Hypoxylon rubiginosum]|uniref:3-hydroxyacyl-CoA dehydrogenase n=1 Tax=Hypoxylon rubiginosum TaxID=110542 RepID=A0ACB9YPQ2_9PEZI|nr:putative 3-hydroxyacyl-CoA dehydrogenase [Hypoxylon rubiginosum]